MSQFFKDCRSVIDNSFTAKIRNAILMHFMTTFCDIYKHINGRFGSGAYGTTQFVLNGTVIALPITFVDLSVFNAIVTPSNPPSTTLSYIFINQYIYDITTPMAINFGKFTDNISKKSLLHAYDDNLISISKNEDSIKIILKVHLYDNRLEHDAYFVQTFLINNREFLSYAAYMAKIKTTTFFNDIANCCEM